MRPKYIAFIIPLILTLSTSLISKPENEISSKTPQLFNEIQKSLFLNNNEKIQEIIEDDPNRLYSIHQETTPVEYAIYLKAWHATELLLALDQKEPLITHHGYKGNPLIHMMIEQGAPYWLLKSALQLQADFCSVLNPQRQTALEILIENSDNPDCAGMLAIAGSQVTPGLIKFALEHKRIETADILLEFYREELEKHPEGNLPEQSWSSADSADQPTGSEPEECLETDI